MDCTIEGIEFTVNELEIINGVKRHCYVSL